MARGGGRGGGRGGRGGGGGGGGTRVVSKAPWSMDPSIEFDPNPSKVFPVSYLPMHPLFLSDRRWFVS